MSCTDRKALDLRGPTSKGRGREGMGYDRMGGEGKEEKEREGGKEGSQSRPPPSKNPRSATVITCVCIVIVLCSLYRAAVRALFSLVVLLIMLCKVACVLLFEQIKKEERHTWNAYFTPWNADCW